jgi:integrase-like protein
VANIHRVMHRALNQAQRWRLVVSNVADLFDPPRQRRPEMKALNPEQARQVLEAAHGDDLEALWVVALTTGLREGELLALRWPDVDLNRGSLRVIASLIRIVGQEPQLAEPKSRRSRRQVELSVAAVDVLRQHRAKTPSIGLVFARPDGRPLSVTTTWKRWRALLERAQVPAYAVPQWPTLSGDAATQPRRSPEDRERDARPLNGRDHTRRLQSRDASDASRGRAGDGRLAGSVTSCRVSVPSQLVASAPPEDSSGGSSSEMTTSVRSYWNLLESIVEIPYQYRPSSRS